MGRLAAVALARPPPRRCQQGLAVRDDQRRERTDGDSEQKRVRLGFRRSADTRWEPSLNDAEPGRRPRKR